MTHNTKKTKSNYINRIAQDPVKLKAFEQEIKAQMS